MKITGITREEEEKFLSDTIEIAQENLERVTREIHALEEDTENYMSEANKSGDKAILTLWNNSKAQLNAARGWLIRNEKARKKPYFGRIDFQDLTDAKTESYYIGRVGITKSVTEPVVIDWRAPIASLYYDNGIGIGAYQVESGEQYEIDLKRKRTYEIELDRLKDFYDMDVVSNDELLTKYLSKNKTEVLGEIIATIQKEQNQIIRRSPKTNVIVQGAAGSGKTTVAMHRISYILFNYAEEFRPEDFYIIGSNEILLNYITGVLPELDVYGVRQMTMEQLLIRLLYEAWDPKKARVRNVDKDNQAEFIKGTDRWFHDLEEFCRNYELSQISDEDIVLKPYKKLLLSGEQIREYIRTNPSVSMQSKRLMLNRILFAKYENFITGRHSVFTEEELKEQERIYSTWFAKWGKYGKADWEGSIFILYQDFLMRQREKGIDIRIPETEFDIYDLAALAYLYKRIKEIDPIREASHVVIDEAQDFGMMAYRCLHYCLRGCTYTIMGDTSQNIHYRYGLNDWNDLKGLVLTGTYDSFRILRKSYRNTIEIAGFATHILNHGDFAVYPVEPIIRHGNPVKVQECASSISFVNEAVNQITEWKEQGYETIAVVCRDDAEVMRVRSKLNRRLDVKDMETGEAQFGTGVMVLSVEHTKGLEFDAVLIWDPDQKKYPSDNGHVKMLYVACTRALHELTILYTRNLTGLITEKVPESRIQEQFQEKSKAAPAIERVTVSRIQKPVIAESKPAPAIETITASRIPEPVIAVNKKETELKDFGKVMADGGIRNLSVYQYGEMPAEKALSVKGHSRSNTAVKWVKKTKTSLEITSNYGVMTLTPVSDECIQVRFAKGIVSTKETSVWKTELQKGLKWSARESGTAVELLTEKILIHIEKRDGALKFMTSDRKILLQEKASETRVIEGTESWDFFEFDRSEKIKSKGPLNDDYTDLTNKARYISYGGRALKMPLLLSNKGYALGIDSERTVMFCGIRSYGPYLYTEGRGEISYYFLYGKSTERNIQLYQRIEIRINDH